MVTSGSRKLASPCKARNLNNAWKSTYNILKTIKANVQIVFVWQDNPKAAAPGETAMINVEW